MCIHLACHLAYLTAVRLLLWGAKQKRPERERVKLIPHIRSLWQTCWVCLTRICLSASRLSSPSKEFSIYIQTLQQTESTPCLPRRPHIYTHTYLDAIRCSVKIIRIAALTHPAIWFEKSLWISSTHQLFCHWQNDVKRSKMTHCGWQAHLPMHEWPLVWWCFHCIDILNLTFGVKV